MFLLSTLFTILLLWGCAFAEQWRQVWVLGKYEGRIEGSKKFSDGESTTWLINCVTSVPGCTFPRNLMLTESSVALSYNYTLKNNCSFNAACKLDKAAPSGDCVLTLQSGSNSSTKSTRVGPEVLTRATMLIVAGAGDTSTTDTSTTTSSTADSSTTTSSSSIADITTSSSSTIVNPSPYKKSPPFSQGSTIIFSPNRTGIAVTGSVFDPRPVRTSSKDFPSPTSISKGNTHQNSISTVGALIIILSILIL